MKKIVGLSVLLFPFVASVSDADVLEKMCQDMPIVKPLSQEPLICHEILRFSGKSFEVMGVQGTRYKCFYKITPDDGQGEVTSCLELISI